MAANPAAFYDALETRDPETRERDLFARLSAHVAHAKKNAPYFANLLKDIDAGAVTDRKALAALPVTRKSDLVTIQKDDPPLGGLTAVRPGNLARIYQSPGPTYDAEGFGTDWWRVARGLYAAGFRKGDILHNAFSYHFTPAGMMLEEGAHALGCAVFPAGVGQTELQVRAIADIRPTGYSGTPSFLKTILEKAKEIGADHASLKKALVAGEALPPSLRADIQAYGVDLYQCYASADLGMIAYEGPPKDGFIVEESLIVEILRPGTGDPLPDGEVGEVVVTTFAADYPLIRFATGDLSAVASGRSACGRTNMRLKGWMGRADQTTKVRGMFVHPAQVADIVKRHPEIARARMVVDQADGKDTMTLMCESAQADPALAARIAETVQAVCKLRGEVSLVAANGLPNDGKVVEDRRKLT